MINHVIYDKKALFSLTLYIQSVRIDRLNKKN